MTTLLKRRFEHKPHKVGKAGKKKKGEMGWDGDRTEQVGHQTLMRRKRKRGPYGRYRNGSLEEVGAGG